MSLPNNHPPLISCKYPPGPPSEWDMTSLDDKSLNAEHQLAIRVLKNIKSDYFENPNQDLIDNDFHKNIFQNWKNRLKRAEDEIERRYLLS